MGESPAHRLTAIFGDQENAMRLGAAMLDIAPVVDGEIEVAAAVGFERGLIVLQAGDEGQDRRFVSGQMCLADLNDRAP
jgi:hypothetical protein